MRGNSLVRATEYVHGRLGLDHRFLHVHFTFLSGHHTTLIARPGAFWTNLLFLFHGGLALFQSYTLADPIYFITQRRREHGWRLTCRCGKGLADHRALVTLQKTQFCMSQPPCVSALSRRARWWQMSWRDSRTMGELFFLHNHLQLPPNNDMVIRNSLLSCLQVFAVWYITTSYNYN